MAGEVRAFHQVMPRCGTVNRLLMFVGMTLGGYVGWWAGDYMGFGLMGTFLVSSLGSLIGIYVAWRVMVDYLELRPTRHELPAMKTNAMRILDTLGIHYEIREYEVDPDDLSAERIASDIGLPPEQVFKTLVARGDRHGVLLAVVPANAEVDFKALARQSDNRTVELVR